jgi:4-amino-4-deoxy-L-arabinose transferase-like glycosyltransferase
VKVSALLAIVAAAAFVVLVATQLGKPLIYDDANFAFAAQAVADTGLPFGNQGWMSERGDFSQRDQWALWHPPLYVYMLGVFAKFGWTPAVLRLPGLLGGLASALLTYLLARDLTRGPVVARQMAGACAVALFLLCPLAVQSALVVDIDFALLLPLTLLFLWLYVRRAPLRLLAVLFGLLLWTKMTNPLPVLLVLVVWQLLRGQPRAAAMHLSVIGLGGIALFIATWVVIGRWLGFPLDMPFGVNLVQWQDSAEVARRAYASPGAFIEGLQPSVLWISPGLVALGLAAIAMRCSQLVRCWRFRHADVLIGLIIVFVLGYVNKNAGWLPKYQVALVPLLACLAAPPIAHAWCDRPRLTLGIAAASAITSFVVVLRLVRDDWALQRSYAVDALAMAWLVGLLALAIVIALPLRAAGIAAFGALAGMALGWSAGTDVVRASAAYATTYQYGTTGTVETAQWLDSHLASDEIYIAAKELAIRAQDKRYVDQDNLLYLFDTGRGFDGSWAGQNVRVIAVWQREPYVADLLRNALPRAGYQTTIQFGDYTVYERQQ